MSGNKLRLATTLVGLLLLGGCSVLQPVTDLFKSDEELEVLTLAPLEPAFDVRTVWQRDIGKGTEGFFSRLTPVVVNNTIFVADRNGTVISLDAAGKTIWRTNIGSASGWFSSGESAKVAGGLAAFDGNIWLGTEDGRVLALSQETGDITFDETVVGEILAKPTFGDGLVYVNTTAGRLFALDLETGEEKWMHESEVPPLSLRGISQPTAANGGVFVGTAAGKLQVSVSDSGLVAWEATVTTPAGATELERIIDVDTTPVIAGGNVYIVSYNGSLVSVELRTGRVVWQREYASYQNLVVSGNSIYVTDVTGSVFAIDRRNGVELWSQNALKGRKLTAPAVLNDSLVVSDGFGTVHFLNTSEGTYQSRIVLDNAEGKGFYSAPVVMDDKVIVINQDGELTLLAPQF